MNLHYFYTSIYPFDKCLIFNGISRVQELFRLISASCSNFMKAAKRTLIWFIFAAVTKSAISIRTYRLNMRIAEHTVTYFAEHTVTSFSWPRFSVLIEKPELFVNAKSFSHKRKIKMETEIIVALMKTLMPEH